MSRKFKLPTQRTRGKTQRWSIHPEIYEKVIKTKERIEGLKNLEKIKSNVFEKNNCINCKNRQICYIFWERYYPIKDLLKDNFGNCELMNDDEINDICDIIKTILPKRCKCYEDYKELTQKIKGKK